MKQIRILQSAINRILKANIAEDGIYGRITNAHFQKLTEWLKPHMFASFDGFVVVRMSQEFDNKFSDFAFYVSNQVVKEVLPCSSKAGDFWVFNPVTYGGIFGTAVLKEGFYPKVWEGRLTYRFGFKSFELQQVRSVTVYRDSKINRMVDKDKTQTGLFGINMHTAGFNNLVNRWSAGCIVVPEPYWTQWCNDFFELGKLYDLNLIEYVHG